MIYNILLIDDNSNFYLTTDILASISDKAIYHGHNQDAIKKYLESYNIHIIIVNTNYFSLDILNELQLKHNTKSDEIPILLVGEYDNLEQYDHLLIYDIIDIKQYEYIVFNKIKFCKM